MACGGLQPFASGGTGDVFRVFLRGLPVALKRLMWVSTAQRFHAFVWTSTCVWEVMLGVLVVSPPTASKGAPPHDIDMELRYSAAVVRV